MSKQSPRPRTYHYSKYSCPKGHDILWVDHSGVCRECIPTQRKQDRLHFFEVKRTDALMELYNKMERAMPWEREEIRERIEVLTNLGSPLKK